MQSASCPTALRAKTRERGSGAFVKRKRYPRAMSREEACWLLECGGQLYTDFWNTALLASPPIRSCVSSALPPARCLISSSCSDTHISRQLEHARHTMDDQRESLVGMKIVYINSAVAGGLFLILATNISSPWVPLLLLGPFSTSSPWSSRSSRSSSRPQRRERSGVTTMAMICSAAAIVSRVERQS